MARRRKPVPAAAGHNGGPPLEDRPHIPEWGTGGPGNYFAWKAVHRRAWRSTGHDTMVRRAAKAEALGLTYEEYVLEILERGIYLQAEDVERIAAIKAGRRARRGRRHL
ncbi:MAG: hypothetical protein NTZ14_04005 [Hyphomicrobiales bacterium]|nr:hypothetical protein [Hyphomicrobiales bacterium]